MATIPANMLKETKFWIEKAREHAMDEDRVIDRDDFIMLCGGVLNTLHILEQLIEGGWADGPEKNVTVVEKISYNNIRRRKHE